jgi:lactate dehydrogenase-like 2-hydroxyacid dehydrogenase
VTGFIMKVLVSDKFPTEGLQILEQAEGIELDYQPGLSTEQLLQAVTDADALIVRSGTQVTARVIEAAKRLQVIGRAGVGVDNIDVDAATQCGILVVNAPDGKSYILKKGIKAGKNDGTVIAINKESIVVEEKFYDFSGDVRVSTQSIPLPKKEGVE